MRSVWILLACTFLCVSSAGYTKMPALGSPCGGAEEMSPHTAAPPVQTDPQQLPEIRVGTTERAQALTVRQQEGICPESRDTATCPAQEVQGTATESRESELLPKFIQSVIARQRLP